MDTYCNPVYAGDFPDPFVLKFCGEYWGYCTGIQADGRCFGIARSPDLVRWERLGGAMAPLPGDWPMYWAPEVLYVNGRFLLYYSVGDEEHMHIRVAAAAHPAGPFVDSGHRLTAEQFAIDPHVLTDDDGARYLFYATDFLSHSHIGTGTVRDRMRDLFTLEGNPVPVTRPRYDWHLFDPQRAAKGGVRWHTIEGSFVLKRKGRYYQMFSGGNWQNLSYGVSYAIAESVATTEEWRQVADGEQVLPVLRTVPGAIVGPGHNSVVRGPDNQQLFCVYHRWSADSSARVMALDPLDWAGERMLVLGPSNTPRPAPLKPTFADRFAERRADGPGAGWRISGGAWSTGDGAAHQRALVGRAEAHCPVVAPAFVAEVSLRAAGAAARGAYGLAVHGAAGRVALVALEPDSGRLSIRVRDGAGWVTHGVALPPDFAADAYHALCIEVDHQFMRVCLDERRSWSGAIPPAQQAALYTDGGAATFAGFALTVGWQNLFDAEASLAALGWQTEQGGVWRLGDQLLHAVGAPERALLVKPAPALPAYELVVNARLDERAADTGGYGVFPALGQPDPGPLVTLQAGGGGWSLLCRSPSAEQRFPLPAGFDPSDFQQFRFRKQRNRLAIQWEATPLGELAAPPGPAHVGLTAHHADAAFDMVRVTALVE